MAASISAVATLTLADACAARPALRAQLGDLVWEDVLAIANDPRPDVITAQNSIWLCSWIPQAFRLIQREEPELAPECGRILRIIDDFTRRIPRRPIEDRAFVPIFDTLEEMRGER